MSDAELSSLKSVLRSLVVSSPAQLDARSLSRDYRQMRGEMLAAAIRRFSYREPVAFLREKCSDCFLFSGSMDNPELTLIVPDSLKHIDKHVQRQRSSAQTKGKGKRRSVPDTKLKPHKTQHRRQSYGTVQKYNIKSPIPNLIHINGNMSKMGDTQPLSEDSEECTTGTDDSLNRAPAAAAPAPALVPVPAAAPVPAPVPAPVAALRDLRVDDDDALPGVDFETDAFPESCMHYCDSVPPARPLAPSGGGGGLRARVGAVLDPRRLWLVPDDPELDRMLREMDRYYSGGGGGALAGPPRVGQYCAAAARGAWHRALLVRAEPQIKVRLVDSGHVAAVAAAALRGLRRCWGARPAAAARAALAGVGAGAGGGGAGRAAGRRLLQLAGGAVYVVVEDVSADGAEVWLTAADGSCINTALLASGLAPPARAPAAAAAAGVEWESASQPGDARMPRWEPPAAPAAPAATRLARLAALRARLAPAAPAPVPAPAPAPAPAPSPGPASLALRRRLDLAKKCLI